MLKKLLTAHLIKTLHIGARSSQLSKIQVEEVCQELSTYYEDLDYIETFVETTGDRDLKTSLRSLEKTDFFTLELDRMVVEGEIDVAIHSAKDLPDPLLSELVCIALTKGKDPRDVLVFRNRADLERFPSKMRIGTSSIRREENLKTMGIEFEAIDIRGSVPQRIDILNSGTIDALVVAEAALIRLGWTHLPRIFIDGESAPNQGRLAVIARDDRKDLKELFAPLNAGYQFKCTQFSTESTIAS